MKKILIIKYGALGDVVRTGYFLEPLYLKHSKPEIYWLTHPNSIPLLQFNPYVFCLTSTPEDFFDIAFDWVISLDDEYEILLHAMKMNCKKFTGAFLEEHLQTYTNDSKLWFDMGKISQFGPEKADQLKKENKLTHTAIFSRILGIQISRPLFFGSSVINTLIGDQMSSEFFRIGINSGSGGRWESKRLPIPETIDLIIRLLKYSIMGKNVFIELLGGVDEQERNFKIKDTFKSNNLVRVFESSDSILHFSALVSNCNYIITSDSLAMHLAIAQSVPNLTFFAPTSAVEIDTFGTGVKVVSTSPEYCNYKSDSDNSSITADRIFGTFIHHLSLLKLPCVKKFC